ncbi:hypothetical protein M441DRAFT_75898 [Trichoderma asperellum CBS 433.97]|uniref:Uncharacterized protein n=1 Tax=Trichoderma asperellum (strain ATCC 204424 / CBS 433.97 / NBRC 101777) TaxID=1042311 RepID=A0A2T3ZQR8_TRIA4|nr:hypothetical protein M441DRAFT_75898 [Trichoderma asperellum CBS 433.97]PTB47152.1 hypothetical protein M441DRAFT_75898 [Trichoderma asperellum CBS 433.97]
MLGRGSLKGYSHRRQQSAGLGEAAGEAIMALATQDGEEAGSPAGLTKALEMLELGGWWKSLEIEESRGSNKSWVLLRTWSVLMLPTSNTANRYGARSTAAIGSG